MSISEPIFKPPCLGCPLIFDRKAGHVPNLEKAGHTEIYNIFNKKFEKFNANFNLC
jgi:hypothetical protein